MIKTIGLYGMYGCGKDTVAKYIQHSLPSWNIIAFGDVVKKVAGILYHIPFDKWMDRQFKMAHRYILEKVGDTLRDMDENIIIDATLVGLNGCNIISDVKTEREAEIVRGLGKLVKIKRITNEQDGIIELMGDELFDYLFNNYGDIDSIENNVEIMLKYFRLKD